MFCKKCGGQIEDDAVICVHCGRSTRESEQIIYEEDKVNPGFCVLSVFIPLFGIIFWAMKHKETPKKAKACGLSAIISWGATFVIYFLFIFIAILASM